MKQINLSRGVFLVMAIVLMTSCISALAMNVTFDAPTTTTIAGSVLFNATVNQPISQYNFSWYMRSSSTANSSWSLIYTDANSTAVECNATIDLTGLIEDANNYEINVSVYNGSSYASAVVTGYTVDQSIPTAPSLSPATTTQLTSSGTQTFTGTIVGGNTTSVTYIIGRGGLSTESQDTTSGTASCTLNTCTFTKSFSSTADNGIWYWQMTATDGTNSTASSVNTLQTTLAPSGGSQPLGSGAGTTAGTTNFAITDSQGNPNLWVIGLGIVVIVGIGILIARRK